MLRNSDEHWCMKTIWTVVPMSTKLALCCKRLIQINSDFERESVNTLFGPKASLKRAVRLYRSVPFFQQYSILRISVSCKRKMVADTRISLTITLCKHRYCDYRESQGIASWSNNF
jgi:hypothetical protein